MVKQTAVSYSTSFLLMQLFLTLGLHVMAPRAGGRPAAVRSLTSSVLAKV